jgi:hypothetical protein
MSETREIWKFPLQIEHEQCLMMPTNPEYLSAQFQNGQLCVWAMIEPDNLKRQYKFFIVGTGHKVPDNVGAYIGTVQQLPHNLVWHVFGEETLS